MRNFYSVFGGCLETDVQFPELRVTARRDPRWIFDRVDSLPDRADLLEIGDQHIYGDVHARLFQHSDGYRIVVDDTGTFEIDSTGTVISVREKAGAWEDFVRAHLLGRVLASALYLQGRMPLHASAVQLGSGVVAFLAPKGVGKSTVALALARNGAKLVTDDTLPVELTDPLISWPGVHSVRIKADSRVALGISEADLETREGKGIVTSIADDSLAHDPAPLVALYLLRPYELPEPDNWSGKLEREEVRGATAALALLSNFKLARMMGSREMPEVLRRAAIVADRSAVYSLAVPRSLDSITKVAVEISKWHQQ